MTDKLDFSLPQREAKTDSAAKGLYALFAVGLVVIVINVVLTVSLVRRPAGAVVTTAGILSADGQKNLALKLEKQGLAMRAVDAWKEYLTLTVPSNDETARILYRMGTLYQGAGNYDMALDSYYRSESCAAVAEIAQEISQRTAKCLESLGKFSALRYELDERVSANTNAKSAGAEVVAELGSRKITREELDRRIEDQIERQLARFAAGMPEDVIQKQKEALFQRASTSTERLQALNSLVAEELLYRRAIELKMGDDPKVRDTIRDLEKSVLAEKA
ncbi:MAG: SurA N-terminal domain-containing protein, partial [bacterium]